MKIGKLEFKAHAAKKPVTLGPDGGFVTASELVSAPALALGSLHALRKADQVKLTLERLTLEPDFKLAFVGTGVVSKDELIEHVKGETELGKLAVQAEMHYCNELMALLRARALPAWPTTPKPTIPKPGPWRPKGKWVFLRMPTRALFCENTTDSVTTPFAQYRIANVHPAFAARGFRVIVLSGTDDVRANFVPNARNTLTVYVGGIGHGAYTLYTGHGGNHILEVGQYDPAEVKGKAFHFLSCQTGAQLGPDTVAKGALCYAGYTENFILVWDDKNTPNVDEFRLFAQADSTFDLQMAAGATAQQAFDATVQAFNAAAAQVPNTVAATYLVWDRDHLKLSGDPATRIMPFRMVRVYVPLKSMQAEDALVSAGELVE